MQEGICLCLERAKQLAQDAIDLAKKSNTTNAFGLYTFAVEEYGKALLLKEQKKMRGKNFIVPAWIFGGKSRKRSNSHQQKFQKALKKLPYECNMITLWSRDVHVPEMEDQKIHVKEINQTATIPAGLTGRFSLTTSPDFEERMKVFYVDWDDKKKEWITPTTPPKKFFLNTMNDFLKFLKVLDK